MHVCHSDGSNRLLYTTLPGCASGRMMPKQRPSWRRSGPDGETAIRTSSPGIRRKRSRITGGHACCSNLRLDVVVGHGLLLALCSTQLRIFLQHSRA